MYIFELITKFLKGKRYEKITTYTPTDENIDGLVEDPGTCEHLFLPLDSSNEVFACKYCGYIEKRENLKDKNIFKRK